MSSGGQMSSAPYLIFVAPLFVTLLAIFAMKYLSAIPQARAGLASEMQHQALAEKAVAAQRQNEATRAAIRAQLTCCATSLAGVESIRQQVE